MDYWFVYIARCSDDTLYTGVAVDVKERIALHNAGKGARYTRGRGPLTVCATRRCRSKGEALRLEHAYSLSSPVQGVLAAYALEPEDADYGESVALTVRVPVGRRAAFVEELGERTAGGVRVEELA